MLTLSHCGEIFCFDPCQDATCSWLHCIEHSVKLLCASAQGADGADLPLVYSPEAINGFWGRRPVAVASRALQLLGIGGSFFARFAFDFFTGRLAATEVQRAIELRNIVTSLGPAFIKLGQALSIRPDLLSPAAMVELQKVWPLPPEPVKLMSMSTSVHSLRQHNNKWGWALFILPRAHTEGT